MLDQTLAAGKVAICIVDIASLPWYGLPAEFIGGGPHVVTVAGRYGDRYWIDDRCVSSHRCRCRHARSGARGLPPGKEPVDRRRRYRPGCRRAHVR